MLSLVLSIIFLLPATNVISDAAALRIRTTMSITSLYVGGKATIKATGSGGTTPYKFKFQYRVGSGSWVTAKSYSSTSTATIEFTSAGTYTFRTYVKDNRSVTAYSDMSATIQEEYVPLKNSSTISASSVTFGRTIKVIGKASGGKAPYTYAFYYTVQDGSKKTFKGFSSTSAVNMNFPTAGYYKVQCAVKDKEGKSTTKSFNVTVIQKTGNNLSNNTTISSSSINLGSTLTIKGKSYGGTQPCKYTFHYSLNGGAFTKISGYDKTAIGSFKPTEPGYYRIRTTVKDMNGKTTEKISSLTVKKKYSYALINDSSISTTDTVEKGTTVNLLGSADGGTAPYQFAYYYKLNNSGWKSISGYSGNTVGTVVLDSTGNYSFKVSVKDSAGNYKDKTISVKSVAPSSSSSGTVKTISLDYGRSTVVAADDAGNKATYAFYYKKSTDSGWTCLQNYSSSRGIRFRPRAIGTYSVLIYTKVDGTSSSKTIKIKSAISAMVKEELALINKERAKVGASPLSLDTDLVFAAGVRAEELETKYSHTRPDGRAWHTVFTDYSVSTGNSTGENIAYGYQNCTTVMNGWMNSSGHKANILNTKYRKVGLGISNKYWNQIFST